MLKTIIHSLFLMEEVHLRFPNLLNEIYLPLLIKKKKEAWSLSGAHQKMASIRNEGKVTCQVLAFFFNYSALFMYKSIF